MPYFADIKTKVNDMTTNKNGQYRHIIDFIFVLALFCLFAVSSVILIIFGADIYQKTVSQMDISFSTRTTAAYITEKIRQFDASGAVSISDSDGVCRLVMSQTIDSKVYELELYEYDGYLCELFTPADIELPLDAGQRVIEISGLDFSFINDSLIKISYIPASGDGSLHADELYISLHSTQGF